MTKTHSIFTGVDFLGQAMGRKITKINKVKCVEIGTIQQQKIPTARLYVRFCWMLLANQSQNTIILSCKSVQSLESLCKKVGFSM